MRLLFSFIETVYGYYDIIINQVPFISNQIMVGSEVGANSGSGTSSISRESSGAGASSGAGTYTILK
jgi:hypothetical protein